MKYQYKKIMDNKQEIINSLVKEKKELVDKVKDLEDLYNLKVDKVMELEEGMDLIYKTLRSAEGIKEIMTGSEPECIAESVGFYVEGFHDKEDEIEELKDNITSLIQEIGRVIS